MVTVLDLSIGLRAQNFPMRLVFAFFLCLAVVFQGSVAAHDFKPVCAMEHPMGDVTPGADISLGDCCNDAHIASESDHLCKTGQACCAPSVFAATPFQEPMPVSGSLRLVPATAWMMLSFDPLGVWRPPTRG